MFDEVICYFYMACTINCGEYDDFVVLVDVLFLLLNFFLSVNL